jgi:hypothetical protein
MKTILSALLSTIIITLALAGNATAAPIDNAKNTRSSLKAAKANSKALKNFTMLYKKEASGASWSMDNDAMIASFTKEDVKTTVAYNKNGNWFHTLTYYPEDKTPQDITSIMDYAYPKDDVRLTVKVEEGGKVFYIVQLDGKTTIRKVTVYNGEVNQIEELIKSK